MQPHVQLKSFLEPYSPEIQAIAMSLRGFITKLVPEANELIWDNYNAVAIAYSKSEILKDAFCHIAVYAKHVNLGFNRGVELTKGTIKLEGKGTLIRHLKVTDIKSLPLKEIEKIIYEAVGISENYNPELSERQIKGVSIVKSISEKKIRPR